MFAPDTNMLHTNLTQAKGDYKTFFHLSRDAYLMLKTNYHDQRILKSEHPSSHNPPTHPNPNNVWNPLKKMDDPLSNSGVFRNWR